MNDYPEVVKQIHNEFNTAGERLLQESLALIGNTDPSKPTRLENVGFKNVPELKRMISPTQMAKLVIENKREFPLNKFISKSDVDKICAKYNLVHGDVEQYKGFVPEKNLFDIEGFLKNKGLKKKFIVKSINFPYNASQSDGINRVKDYIKKEGSILLSTSEEKAKYFLMHEIGGRTSNGITSLEAIFIEKSPLTICAPKSDMDDKSWISKILPFGTTFTNINPDPVVLYPVEHGYIIVTAWGDEASDPLVVNEQMN